VFPKTFESWLFLIAACVIGFFIGHWLRKRRSKTEVARDALIKMVNSQPKKRASKKEKRKASRPSK
jgi:hypothetical protein